jgi:hypothetical protein
MKRLLKRRELTLVLVIAVLVAAISLRHPAFLRASNLYDILDDTATIMRKSRDEMLAEVFGPPTREFMQCVLNDLRKALELKVHRGPKNGHGRA